MAKISKELEKTVDEMSTKDIESQIQFQTKAKGADKVIEVLKSGDKTAEAELKDMPMKDVIDAFNKVKKDNPNLQLEGKSRSKANYIKTLKNVLNVESSTKKTEVKTIVDYLKSKYGEGYDNIDRAVREMEKHGADRISDLDAAGRKSFLESIEKHNAYKAELQRRRDRLKKNVLDSMNTLSANPFLNPKQAEIAKDMAFIGADYIRKGYKSFSQFSQKMVKEFGQKVKPWLKDLYVRSKEYVENPKIATEGIHLVPDVKVKDLKDNKKLEEIGYEFSSSKLFDGKESHPQLNVKEDVGKFLSDRSKSLQEK